LYIICSDSYDSTYENEILDFELEKRVPYLLDGFIKIDNFENESFPALKDGDLIIADASEDYEGVCDCLELKNLNGKKVVAGLHTFAARTEEENIALGFRTYVLERQQVVRELRRIATGTSVYGVSKTNISKIKIALPPLPEQIAIAQLLSTWDNAITKTQALIAQKEQRKKWLMQNLLTGKMRLKGFEKTKWNLKSLEEVAEFKNGKAHENSIDEEGRYIVVNSKFISRNGAVFKCSNDNLCPLFTNEIAMVMSDIPNGKALAKCFFVNENNKYTLNQRICCIKAFDETDSRFLFFILNRNSHYLSFNNGVGQTNLRKEEVLECPLMMPSKEEQTAIAQVLQAADREIQLLKAKSDKLREQKKGLMQVLLTGKKRLII
jgi:type I restriction enzyme S subunit